MIEKLNQWVEIATGTPFEWGKFDCALMVCDWLLFAYGYDAGETFRGKYSTEQGSKREMIRQGYHSFTELGDDLIRGERVNINFSQRGDIILLKVCGMETFGVDIGQYVLIAETNGAKVAYKKDTDIELIKAWRGI